MPNHFLKTLQPTVDLIHQHHVSAMSIIHGWKSQHLPNPDGLGWSEVKVQAEKEVLIDMEQLAEKDDSVVANCHLLVENLKVVN